MASIGAARRLANTLGVNRKEGMKMTRVRVEGFTISLDGYGAGPNQDIRNPLGVGGADLHQWLVPTRTLQRTLFGADGGTTGFDDDFAFLNGCAGHDRFGRGGRFTLRDQQEAGAQHR